MKKRILLAAALAAASGSAVAGPSAGDIEIVFSNLGAAFATDGDATVLGASVRAGKFIEGSNHELGAAAALAYVDSDHGSDEVLGLGAFYRYNFATTQSRKWFYLGADFDIGDVQEAGDSLYLRPHAGHKWMLTDDVSFDLNAGILVDVDNSDVDPLFDAQFGITVFFK